EGKQIFHVVAHIDPLCAMPIAALQLLNSALGPIVQILGTRPEAESAAHAKKLELLIATNAAESDVISKSRIPTVISRVECFAVNAAEHATTKAAERPSAPEASPAQDQLTETLE